jgi:RNA ligase partner protein
MQKTIVVDTTVFTDPGVAREFSGQCARANMPTWALKNVLLAARKRTDVHLMTTPQVWAEIEKFVNFKKDKNLAGLVANELAQKSHDPGLLMPAYLMLEYVAEMRQRNHAAELRGVKDLKTAIQMDLEKDGFKEPGADLVANYRATVRRMTREGTVDSEADMSLILLAYQENAILVTSDTGLMLWAQKFGVQVLPASVFSQMMIQ